MQHLFMKSSPDVYSYKTKSLVKWGASGTVVFVTKEAKMCGIGVGDPVVVSVVESRKGKSILIEKLPIRMKKA